MLEISDGERAYLADMRALAADAHGREILIGLTFEESREYVRYLSHRLTGQHPDSEASDRYLALHEKHELARFAVIAAQAAARNDPSKSH